MSSKVTISAEDYQYLDSFQKAAAQAVRNSFGKIIGYQVYDYVARGVRAKKLQAQKKFENEINSINNLIYQVENESQMSHQEISNIVNQTMESYQNSLENNLDLNKVTKIFNEATSVAANKINEYHQRSINDFREKIDHMINVYQENLNDTYKKDLNEINNLKNDLAKQKDIANKYAIAYLNKAKAALQSLEAMYDENYNNINVINNLKNTLNTCDNNVKNGLYEAALAVAVDVTSQSYLEILNFDLQRHEYNNLLKEATYHVDFLLEYCQERMKLSPQVIETVNQMSEGKRISKSMTKKELRYFSPDHKIDLNMQLLKEYQAKLKNEKSYPLSKLKQDFEEIKCLYPQVDQAFNDAIAYYGNYLEREAFMNNIIDKFEDHGRIFLSMHLGEKEDENDFTQPIFILFEDETTGSEFMVEINYVGSPDTRLQSEFHVHRIKGDPYNQHENEMTEKLVHQAIDEEDEDYVHSGIGCNRSTIGKLSDDQRILRVRNLMR